MSVLFNTNKVSEREKKVNTKSTKELR